MSAALFPAKPNRAFSHERRWGKGKSELHLHLKHPKYNKGKERRFISNRAKKGTNAKTRNNLVVFFKTTGLKMLHERVNT